MEDNDEVEDNDKDNNNYKDISALGLDRDLGFSWGHQGHWPPDDDDEEEEDDVVEDNYDVEDNDKDDTNYKDISALGLDRNLGFTGGHQTKPNQTCPDSRKLAQIRTNSRRFMQTRANSI